jgi:F-type H+-transporting ATPase subunit delta
MKVSATQYARTLLELTENKSEQEISAVVVKFAEQMKKDGQLKNAGAIMEKFSELYNKAHGIVATQVCGRREVSPEVLKKVGAFVKEKYSAQEVEMEVVVDEKIQGGIIIKVGDEIIDGSVASQLKRLKKELTK